VVSGALLGLAFLPRAPGWIAWFALVPLLAALERRPAASKSLRTSFGLGYAWGLGCFVIGAHWIALLSDVAITVPWLKYPAWLAAAAYLALFPALACTLAAWAARRSRLSVAAVFPFAWLTLEEVRASGELGFPWFQPGYTQHAYAPLIQMASLGSVSLVTLWLVTLNVLLWRALRPAATAGDDSAPARRWWRDGARQRAALGAALALALPWLWGTRVLEAADSAAAAARPTVALIQGNIPGEMKWSGRHQPEILNRFLELSEGAARRQPKPALLIWPETATGSYLRRQFDQALAIGQLCARTGVPVFTGFPDALVDSLGKPIYQNAAGLFLPSGGVSETYAKRHLVPFGERMPFQRFVPGLGKLELGQAEWTPGDAPRLFPSAAGPFSCLICFEAIFPDLSRADVRAGAQWLVNITNDEWFGDSAALYQHAAMARFRCVENHVPMARCANTGLTLIVDAYGRIVARAPVWKVAVLSDVLPAPGRPTWYTRVGDWPGWLAFALLAVNIILGKLGGRNPNK
jgi:apolipoprotein N-acyltransferase